VSDDFIGESPFPSDALTSIQRNLAKAIAEALLISPEIICGCILAATSAACGRALLTPSGPDRKLGANIYHLMSAPSGFGKSSLFQPCFGPLFRFQADRHDRFMELERPVLELEKTKLQKELQDYRSKIGSKKFVEGQEEQMTQNIARLEQIEVENKAPQVLCEDTTTEALSVVLKSNHEQIFSLSADADKVFRNIEGRYVPGQQIDDSLYVKSYNRDPYVCNRISRPNILLRSPCMNICWLTQPARLARLFGNPEFRDGGLLPRFLIIDRSPDISTIPEQVPPIDSEIREAYDSMLYRLLAHFWDSKVELVIPESPEVYHVFRHYYNRLVPRMNGQDRDIAHFLKRWQEQAWRIALSLHAALHQAEASQRPISITTAENAIRIVDWYAAEQLRVLAPVRENFLFDWFRKLVGFLQSQPEQQAPLRQIMRRFHWTREQLEKLLENFATSLQREFGLAPTRGGHRIEIVRLLKP
jgi:hypothetical protein